MRVFTVSVCYLDVLALTDIPLIVAVGPVRHVQCLPEIIATISLTKPQLTHEPY